MNYKRFGNTCYARFDRGEEVTECLKTLCEKEGIRLATVQALGATDNFTVCVYDTIEKEYHFLDYNTAHEIVSLVGSVNTMNGEYYSHLHMSAANTAGNVVGGHLKRAVISATCEMTIFITDGTLDRFKDEVTGLNLYRFNGETSV